MQRFGEVGLPICGPICDATYGARRATTLTVPDRRSTASIAPATRRNECPRPLRSTPPPITARIHAKAGTTVVPKLGHEEALTHSGV